MPKYREERELTRPIPGAHGLERSKEEWEKRCRPNAAFLSGTGHYADHLRILISEEYGYREWLWTFPGTVEEVIEEWKAGRVPGICSRRRIKGEVDRVDWRADPDGEAHRAVLTLWDTGEVVECIRYVHRIQPWPGAADGVAHVHEFDDSELKIGHYRVEGLPVRDYADEGVRVYIDGEQVLNELANL